jgi:hypothetical protein
LSVVRGDASIIVEINRTIRATHAVSRLIRVIAAHFAPDRESLSLQLKRYRLSSG